MPQDGFSFNGRQDGERHNTHKANRPINGQFPGRNLVNRSVFQHGCPAACRTGESLTARSLDPPKPAGTKNSHINHRCKKAAPPKTCRRQPGTCSAAGGMGGVGGSGQDGVTLCSKSEQVVPDLRPSEKNQRRRTRFRAMKKTRGSDVTSSESPAPPPASLHQMEDWEQEVRDSNHMTESTLEQWKMMCVGVTPYGPEDVFHLEFEGLTLQQDATAHQSVTASYSPAVHHASPVRWSRCRVSSEPEQFANSEI